LKLPNKEGKLQTSGIYGVVRHPIYFGDAFWPLGWSIMFNASYSLMLSPLWLIILLLFSSVEEERLVEEYGDEYVKYKQRVRKRIIPGII
jgi:protein-S-isoprenylcysteine O-methyltransferase Ste14